MKDERLPMSSAQLVSSSWRFKLNGAFVVDEKLDGPEERQTERREKPKVQPMLAHILDAKTLHTHTVMHPYSTMLCK